jgi:uncharacterized protein YcfL
MQKNIISLVVVFVLLVSCKSNDAFKYSQAFVAGENSLSTNIEYTENSVEKYIADEHYDSIAIVSEKMEMQIDSLVKVFKAKPASTGKLGEKFKVDGIKYFEFFKAIYASYKDYGKASSEANRNIAVEKMQSLIAKKEDVIKLVQQSQKEFAEANGFRLEK